LILVGLLFGALYFGALAMLAFNLQLPLNPNSGVSNKTPTVNITLFAGEISNNKFGFGTARNNITSPGPTIRCNISDVVSVTVINVGTMPHAFAVTSTPKSGAAVLFDAAIGSASNPLQPGEQGTVIFAPGNAGSFYYICPVPGHAELGMYGSVIVTG
jgi:FtsP/CotA-like multicopper oxidase with cupredoxin domain